ncbi:hypothetical protein GCM10009810_17340 [Nostocoides vanveenii]|uniref:MFS transporter n=1 Tax=Nostocoides vanveenii TaxID=330835 RepID=A0ABP4WSF2_9MICO
MIMGLLGNRSILWTIAIIGIGSIAVSVALAKAARAAARDRSGVPEGGGLLDAIRRREIGLLVGGLVLLGAANTAAVSVTNLFVTDRLDLHVLLGGVALGVAAALEIPFLLVLGKVAERVAPKRLLKLGAVAAVAYYAAMMLVDGPISLVAVQIFNAASIAAVQGIGLTVLQDALPGPGLASGLFMNSIRVGAVLAGPLITLGAAPELGYAAVFLGAAVIGASAWECCSSPVRHAPPRSTSLADVRRIGGAVPKNPLRTQILRPMTSAQAGWYAQPDGRRLYWDGVAWTAGPTPQDRPLSAYDPMTGAPYGTASYGQPSPQTGLQPYGLAAGQPGLPQAYGAPAVSYPPPYAVAPVVAPKNPGLSLIASFFIPGLGTMINGEVGKGIAFLLIYLISWPLILVFVGVPLMLGVWIWGMVDAYTGAQNWNRRYGIWS